MPTKTTGTAFPGGWDVWNNGYVEQSVAFPSTGAYTFDVVAAGHKAAAVWPVMELRIDGHASGTLSANSTSFGHYHLTVHSIGGGAHRVALAFTNYAWVPPEERALLLDKITIAHDPGVGANGSVLLSWVAPSARADGTPLTDLAGYVDTMVRRRRHTPPSSASRT